eukprot:jgi/Mesen1/3220/ME001865S02417
MSQSSPSSSLTPQQEAAVQEWGRVTSFGILGGMMFGGAREAMRAAAPDDALLPPSRHMSSSAAATGGPPSPPPNSYSARRTLMEQRLLAITRGSLVGGCQLGAFAGIFSAVEVGTAAARGEKDMWNTVAAGAATCCLFGLARPASAGWRMRAAASATVAGALLSLPLGLLNSMLQSLAPEATVSPSSSLAVTGGASQEDDVGAAISRLQRRFDNRQEAMAASANKSGGEKSSK